LKRIIPKTLFNCHPKFNLRNDTTRDRRPTEGSTNYPAAKTTEIKKDKKPQTPPVEVKPIQIDVEKLDETPVKEPKAFEIVKSILQKSGPDISKLNYKHTTNYLSINNRVPTG
jgi:hypothetical protein